MYKLSSVDGFVIRIEDHVNIPMVGDNGDYIEYLAWVEAGNTAEPAPVVEAVATVNETEALRNEVDDLKKKLSALITLLTPAS